MPCRDIRCPIGPSATLDVLAGTKTLSSHVEVAPPPSQAAQRPCPATPHGSLAVWALPEIPVAVARGIKRWYMRFFPHRPPSYADVRRTAMVRSIGVGASVVHWIETEPRTHGDHHHSLVFSQSVTLHLTAIVTKLLKMAAERRGVWSEPAAIPGLSDVEGGSGVTRAALWSHKRAGAADTAMVGKTKAELFYNRATALAAIRNAALK